MPRAAAARDLLFGLLALRRLLRFRRFSLDAGMRRVSNVSSAKSREAPDNDVNAHPHFPPARLIWKN